MMLKNIKIDVIKLMEVIDKCEDNVYAVTKEGDKLNLRSKLSQLVGIGKLIQEGQITIDRLEFDSFNDESRVFRFILYGEE